MPYKLPNTFNAQTPLGQSVSNLMTAYFGNMPTPADQAKADLMRAQTEAAGTTNDLNRQKLNAPVELGDLVKKIIADQGPQEITTMGEAPRTEDSPFGPLEAVPTTTTQPGMSAHDAYTANLGDLVAAVYKSGHPGELGNLVRGITPWQPKATERDMDMAMLGAGDSYGSTMGGTREKEANDIQKIQMQQAGQDRRANAASTKTNNNAIKTFDHKQEVANQAKMKGKQAFDDSLMQISGLYDKLQQGGAAVSSDNSMAKNAINYLASTSSPDGMFSFLPAGQTVGKMLGTPAQSIRNEINSALPLLLLDLKNATGMTAKQLDSDKDVAFIKQALTSPNLDYESVKNSLRNLSRKFGVGSLGGGAPNTDVPAAPMDEAVTKVIDGVTYIQGPDGWYTE